MIRDDYINMQKMRISKKYEFDVTSLQVPSNLVSGLDTFFKG